MELANAPVPVPSVVWLPLITGFVVVLQQTPRAVTVEPPSELILPPLAAVVLVIDVGAVVVSVGAMADGLVGPPFSTLISFSQPKASTDKSIARQTCFMNDDLKFKCSLI
jgi:hypothetical protein